MSDIAQVPMDQSVNKPTSGSYGEGAELDRLKQSLPASQPVAQPPVAATGAGPLTPMPGPSTPAPPAGGLPEVLMAPTTQPDTPVGTPLSGPPSPVQGAAVNAAQQRLAVLDTLATSDQVSEETREWASTVRDYLIRAMR